MSQRLNLSIELGKQTRNGANDHSERQHISIVVLGSFAGDVGNPLHSPETSLHPVDIDTFDQLMARLKPSLEIFSKSSEQPLSISFENLEDFHPDRLHDRLTIFQTGQATIPPANMPGATPSIDNEPSARSESDQQTLARLLGERSLKSEQSPTPQSTLSPAKQTRVESVVQQLARNSLQADPNTVSDNDPARPERLETTTAVMRQLLHDASFQALESRWRGLDWLLRSIEPDETCQTYVLNLSHSALEKGLQQNQDRRQTDLSQLIQNQFSERRSSEHKLILICDDSFAPKQEEIATLDGLGRLAESVDATLIAAANDCFAEDGDTTLCDFNAWNAFRKTSVAERITLVLPRVLLRLPYGQNYDPIETFPFEELDHEWSPADLLWGNPAYALAILLAIQRIEHHSQHDNMLTDCPAFAFRRDDDHHLQPCTEYLYQERQIRQLLDLGLVPIIGSRHSNTIQLPWFQSL